MYKYDVNMCDAIKQNESKLATFWDIAKLKEKFPLFFVLHKLQLFVSLELNVNPTRANEALWGRYQNWHFKFNMLFNI